MVRMPDTRRALDALVQNKEARPPECQEQRFQGPLPITSLAAAHLRLEAELLPGESVMGSLVALNERLLFYEAQRRNRTA
jgi:hypothetical protein